MLKLINAELFSFKTIEVRDDKNDKSYKKIQMVSSEDVQQPKAEHSSYGTGRPSFSERATANTTVKPEDLRPVNREILRISAPLKDSDEMSLDTYVKNLTMPMSLNVKAAGQNGQHVELRCHEQGDDRANLLAIAFPFNGMIKPIPLNEQYRIYKGVIVSSAKPFYFNGVRYRKILYLLVEVNKNLFKPDHKYHTDSVVIELESYAIYDDRETGEKNTKHEKLTLSIVSAGMDLIENWEHEKYDEPIYIKSEPGENLWTLFKFTNKFATANESPRNNRDNHGQRNTQRSNVTTAAASNKPAVTYNKHGIRKEDAPADKKSSSYVIDRFFEEEDGDFRRGGRGKKNERTRGKNLYR